MLGQKINPATLAWLGKLTVHLNPSNLFRSHGTLGSQGLYFEIQTTSSPVTFSLSSLKKKILSFSPQLYSELNPSFPSFKIPPLPFAVFVPFSR